MDHAPVPMTLGEMMDEVNKYSDSALVEFRGVAYSGAAPGEFFSWRGSYANLSVEPSRERTTASEFSTAMDNANGVEMTGWKGGDYFMDRGTYVFVAFEGECGVGPTDLPMSDPMWNTYSAVTGVTLDAGVVYLEVGFCDW